MSEKIIGMREGEKIARRYAKTTAYGGDPFALARSHAAEEIADLIAAAIGDEEHGGVLPVPPHQFGPSEEVP